ncbi:MAG: hypothetical protein AAF632_00320 [Bacteroidota bacterium]
MKGLFVLSTFLIANHLYAQKFEKEDLYRTWCLDKYSDEETYYEPPKKEVGDYIRLKEDMTYEVKSEGVLDSGTWMLNTNGNYLELKSDPGTSPGQEGKAEKLYLYFLSTQSMVFTYDVDEYRIWEAHYVSCN